MKRFVCFILLIATFSVGSVKAETNWPRFRGPAGMGHSTQKLPTHWDENDVVWRVELPGEGQSSPSVWEDRIFLTTANGSGKERTLLCLNRADGKEVWRSSIACERPEELHKMNTFASATPVTDGKSVVAFFGRGGLHCFDIAGKKRWSQDLGAFDGPWGTAASPIIVGDLVVQNCDADNAAFLAAFDLATGKEVWRTERTVVRGWSTPVLLEVAGESQLVMNGHTGLTGYDPTTGKQLWFARGDNGRGTPSVVQAGDLLVAVAGRPGDMIGVKASANDVSEVWRVARRSGRDLPSPIVVGEHLFVIGMAGIGSCYDVSTGKQLWQSRIGGNYSASPIAAGGLVYIPSESGEVIVLKLGEKMEIVARNSCGVGQGEIVRASLAPSNGQLLLRSTKALYCIGKTE